VRSSEEIFLAEKGDTWVLGRPLRDGPSNLFLADVLEGPKTKAPLTAADFGHRDSDGSGLGELERPYWSYAVTLEPGATGIVMNALIVDKTNDALAAQLESPAGLHLEWLNGVAEQQYPLFLNFLFSAPSGTFVQPVCGGTYTNQVPIDLVITGDPVKYLEIFTLVHGYPYDFPHIDPSGYKVIIFRGPWSGTEFVGSVNVGQCYQSETGEILILSELRAEDGTVSHPSCYVFDGRSNRNMARIISPSQGSYVQGEITISGEFFSHNLPGKGSLYLDQILLKEMAVQDNKYEYPGGTLSAAVDTETLTEGLHTAMIIITDAAGQNVGSHSIQFIVGTDPNPIIIEKPPPQVTIYSPSESSFVGGMVPIAFGATSKFRIVSLSLLINGTRVQEKTGSASLLESAFDWDTLSSSNGTYEIRVVAVDDQGLSAQKSITVQVRNTLIGLSASRQVDKAWLISKAYGALTFSVVEEGNNPPTLFLILRKVGEGAFQTVCEVVASAVPSSGYSYADKFLDKNTTYTYRVEAVDDSGRTVGRSIEYTI
jgi:hypothetical protein